MMFLRYARPLFLLAAVLVHPLAANAADAKDKGGEKGFMDGLNSMLKSVGDGVRGAGEAVGKGTKEASKEVDKSAAEGRKAVVGDKH